MHPQIVWFRNDLRLKDQPALFAAAEAGPVILVYVMPETWNATFAAGMPRMGNRRKQFLLECLSDLREQLRDMGSDLVVREGKAEQVLLEIARECGAVALHHSHEPADEEQKVSLRVRDAFRSAGLQCFVHDVNSLYRREDLPFEVAQTPDTFSKFRGKVEKYAEIPDPLPIPNLRRPERFPEPGDLPLVAPSPSHEGAVLHFRGGERAAWQRLMDYCGPQGQLRNYKETRNGLLGADYSSKFSPWLASGCISPRSIVKQVRAYEATVVQNDSTYWMIFELLWREYFRWWAEKCGNSIFQFEGPRNAPYKLHPRADGRFAAWAEGRTGIPFIDANMRELNATGFMSNRGRQVVASFLVKDLGVNWLRGAEYFESQLLDYDVHSNWGNWCYVAGVGADPRQDRYFHTLIQADRYDHDGAYVRHWLPELAAVPGKDIHTVFALSSAQLAKAGIALGENYPWPIVLPSAWKKQLPSSFSHQFTH